MVQVVNNIMASLKKIIELEYVGDNKVVMFKCDWWDVENYGKGIKVDAHGITIVNKRCSLKTNEPFVLACQCEQVFYIEDISNANWLCVMKVTPRDFFDIPLPKDGEDNDNERAENLEAYQQHMPSDQGETSNTLDNDNNIVLTWNRVDTSALVVDANTSVILEDD